jgi:Phosphotriesterase family
LGAESVGVVDSTDDHRIALLVRTIEAGYANRWVLSHDVGMKNMLRTHGGDGYVRLNLDLSLTMGATASAPPLVS